MLTKTRAAASSIWKLSGCLLEPDIAGFCPRYRIDDRERTVAEAHQHAMARGVHTHIVGVVAELDAADRRQSSPSSNRTEPSPPFAT
jgi:hypothetical protein